MRKTQIEKFFPGAKVTVNVQGMRSFTATYEGYEFNTAMFTKDDGEQIEVEGGLIDSMEVLNG
jgi:hypothetical protein